MLFSPNPRQTYSDIAKQNKKLTKKKTIKRNTTTCKTKWASLVCPRRKRRIKKKHARERERERERERKPSEVKNGKKPRIECVKPDAWRGIDRGGRSGGAGIRSMAVRSKPPMISSAKDAKRPTEQRPSVSVTCPRPRNAKRFHLVRPWHCRRRTQSIAVEKEKEKRREKKKKKRSSRRTVRQNLAIKSVAKRRH